MARLCTCNRRSPCWREWSERMAAHTDEAVLTIRSGISNQWPRPHPLRPPSFSVCVRCAKLSRIRDLIDFGAPHRAAAER